MFSERKGEALLVVSVDFKIFYGKEGGLLASARGKMAKHPPATRASMAPGAERGLA